MKEHFLCNNTWAKLLTLVISILCFYTRWFIYVEKTDSKDSKDLINTIGFLIKNVLEIITATLTIIYNMWIFPRYLRKSMIEYFKKCKPDESDTVKDTEGLFHVIPRHS